MFRMFSEARSIYDERGLFYLIKKSLRIKFGYTRMDYIIKSHPLLSILITSVYALLRGHIIIRYKNRYINYSIMKNVFGKRTFHFHDFKIIKKLWRTEQILNGKRESRYFSHDFTRIEPTDTVIDIGAARGLTTQEIAEQAERVIAVEPSPRMFDVLKQNIECENVDLYQYAISNETKELEFNYGAQARDDSLLTPDTGRTGESHIVQAIRLDDFIKLLDVDKVDLVKIEAEGSEPEAIDGLGEINPEKIVVNCSPERDGKSPSEDVSNKLIMRQYEIDSPNERAEVYGRYCERT